MAANTGPIHAGHVYSVGHGLYGGPYVRSYATVGGGKLTVAKTKGSAPTLTVELSDVVNVEPSASALKKFYHKTIDGKWGFQVMTKQQSFVFFADTEAEMKAWVEVLTKLIPQRRKSYSDTGVESELLASIENETDGGEDTVNFDAEWEEWEKLAAPILQQAAQRADENIAGTELPASNITQHTQKLASSQSGDGDMESDDSVSLEEYTLLKHRCEALEQKLKIMENMLALKEERTNIMIRELENAANIRKHEINNQQRLVLFYAQRQLALDTKFRRLKSRYASSEEEVGEKTKRLAAMTETVTRLEGQLAEKTQELEAANTHWRQAREAIKALTHQNALLDRNLKTTQTELQETYAKYGLLDTTEIGAVLEKQREYLHENGELKEIIASKDMQVTALKEMLSDTQSQAKKLAQRVAALEDELATARKHAAAAERELEPLRRTLARTNEALAEQSAAMALLKKEAEGVADAIRLKDECIDLLIEKLRNAEAETATRQAELDYHVQAAKKFEEDIHTLNVRIDVLKKDLKHTRKEAEVKDAQIMKLLRDKASANATSPVGTPLAGHHQSAEHTSNKIAELEAELAVAREAVEAHKSQVVLLSSELKRVESESAMQLKIQKTTVQRITRELEAYKKAYHKLAATRGGAALPQPLDIPVDNTATASGINSEIVESLKSELELVKKEYFFSLTLGIKLSMAMQGVAVNVDVASLYDRVLRERVPTTRWQEWAVDECQKAAQQTST